MCIKLLERRLAIYLLKRKKFEVVWFSSKHAFELNLLFSIFLKPNQIKIDKAGVKLQTYVHYKYFLIFESKVKVDKTYMKTSKYQNSVFPYCVHSTVNLPTWRPKDTNVSECLFSSIQ